MNFQIISKIHRGLVVLLPVVALLLSACSGMTVSFGDEPQPGSTGDKAPLTEADIQATVSAALAASAEPVIVEPELPDFEATMAVLISTVDDSETTPEQADMQATITAQQAFIEEAIAGATRAVELAQTAAAPVEPEEPSAPILVVNEDPTLPPPTQLPTLTPTAELPYGVVTAPSSVNVRGGPDTEYPRLRVSARGSRLEVVGRSLDNEWWQVRMADLPGGTGWVSANYLETHNTGNIPVVSAPALPTPTPTNTAVPTLPPTPTRTPQPQAPEPPPPAPPSQNADLNYGLSPRYGVNSLRADGSRDTVSYNIEVGGSVNADTDSGLPGSCYGYVRSNAPDMRIEWSGGDLAIYFQATGGLGLTATSPPDTTLIVNTAGGNWVCNDDGLGNLQPLVWLPNASSGNYDIWVGRYSEGTANGALIFGEFQP